MPHADSSTVPESIKSKAEFWEHVLTQLTALLEDQRSWVSNLANAAALIYTSLLDFPLFFGRVEGRAVNWCGFYIQEERFPGTQTSCQNTKLLLGPFCGKPACQFINIAPGRARGVCADAFLQKKTLVVPDVDSYPGHIACDGDTKSEIVSPLIAHRPEGETVLGVLDLDCLASGAFDDDDRIGLERISDFIVRACDW